MRKRTINLLITLTAITAIASFSRSPRAVEAASSAPAPESRVITQLVGRDQSITVSSTARGVRYSVAVEGKTIVANATLDELRTKHPEAFRQIQSSIADTSPKVWAGVDLDR